jgi:hypothetical protein
MHRLAEMIHAIIELGETRGAYRHREPLSTLGDIGGRHFIFREDGSVRAFRDTRTAINAGIRINIVPWPLLDRFPGNNAVNWTHRGAASVTQT